MKKIVLFVIGLFLISLSVEAQEQSALTHYHVNPVLINPAAAGVSGNQQIFLNARTQWTSFPGAPKTYALTYDGPFGKTFGLGATIYSEQISYINRFRASINYAFRYDLDKLKVGFGFSTEFSQKKLDNEIMNDLNTDLSDDVIEDGLAGINQFDATLGFYGMYNEQTFFGIAFPNIIMARLDGNTGSIDDEPEGYYLFNMGHRFKSEAYGFTIEPSLLLRKARNVPFQADINLKGYFLEDKLIGGVSYRGGSRGALGILIGTKLTNFGLYYSFDVSFQEFQQYSNGAHEVTISFSLPRKSTPPPAIKGN